MNTKINKYAWTKQPICICASCNFIHKELGLNALAHEVCVHKQWTHRHTPVETCASVEKLTLQLAPRPQGGTHGENCRECKKAVPSFLFTSFLFLPSPHPITYSDRLRGEKELGLYSLISFFYHQLKNKLLRRALKLIPEVSLSPCDSVKHKISWMQLRGQCRGHRADSNPAGEGVCVCLRGQKIRDD